MTKADKARRLIEEFPTLSKKALGKLLKKKYPKDFTDDEHGRFYIKSVINGLGRIPRTHQDIYLGPNLKKGKKNFFTPFTVKGRNVGIIADIHIPYHDQRALNIALSYLKKRNIDTLIIDGDLIDCYHISRFEKDRRERHTLWDELSMMVKFLTDLRINFPDAEIIFKLGNHDERYESFLNSDTNLVNFKVLSFDHLINSYGETEEEQKLARSRNIKIVSEKRILKIGKLNVCHGQEFGRSIFSPVNPARGLYLRSKTNTIAGHHHQTSEHVEKDLNDNITGCWSIGCLSDLHPAYMPINKFNHGFAHVLRHDNGNFSIDNKKILNYQIV